MRLRLAPLLALLLSAAAGCNTDFPPQYRVTDLRVLAVRARVQGALVADPVPGDTVLLDLLLANPTGRAGVTAAWYACQPTASEALSPCLDASFLSDLSRLDRDPRVLRLGTGAEISLALPAEGPILDATRFVLEVAAKDPAFGCRLYTELPVLTVVRHEGVELLSVKRVRVFPTRAQLVEAGLDADAVLGDQNENPAVADVLRAPANRYACEGGTSLGAGPFPAGETALCGLADLSRPQSSRVCGPGGPTGERDAEQLTWQWYVTAGEFPDFGGVGNATGGDTDFARPPGPFTLWAIIRDGRGGVGWQSWAIGAAP